MLGIPLGLLAANAFEWFAHNKLLHEYGKSRSGSAHFHWDHHREVRRHDFFEPQYEHLLGEDYARHRYEIEALVRVSLIVSPLFPIAPFFTATLWYSAFNYYHCHRKAHEDPEWAREHLPWHVDHHMGRNQDTNWCVTKPWFDYIMGTRVLTNHSKPESNPLGIPLPKPVKDFLWQLVPRPKYEPARATAAA
ncbi:hypothetical protein [Turneriella parva]|uniref:Fatty acid hydroxylase n=1 Tax=Turneriella parva (strain ATCC BAA-1111 / DSM 21527 / NCTC 11395 / H) TaxID=869212 RepID=I4B230_TURPD|nr:hypothetical protein [Turneriella parva]AFM11337.1 hypothetical protein Turpa_0686 [Turneriella parva DSM 21527]